MAFFRPVCPEAKGRGRLSKTHIYMVWKASGASRLYGNDDMPLKTHIYIYIYIRQIAPFRPLCPAGLACTSPLKTYIYIYMV